MKTIIKERELLQLQRVHQSRYRYIRMMVWEKITERVGVSRKSNDCRDTQHRAQTNVEYIKAHAG